MAETDVAEGGCLCGAVRYRIERPREAKPLWCHCAMCRKAAGSPAVAWLTVRREHFRSTGQEPVAYASSDHAVRSFCGRCGSPITFVSTEEPEHLDVTLGTLDEPERIAPKRHIWIEARLPWLRLDAHLPDVPRDTGQGPPG